jgi:hypothetical protein
MRTNKNKVNPNKVSQFKLNFILFKHGFQNKPQNTTKNLENNLISQIQQQSGSSLNPEAGIVDPRIQFHCRYIGLNLSLGSSCGIIVGRAFVLSCN